MRVLEVEKQFPKKITDKALDNCPDVKKCLVVKYTKNKVDMVAQRDLYLEDLINEVDDYCEPEEMNADLFYTHQVPLENQRVCCIQQAGI